MKVVIEGRDVVLDESRLLGTGGEASVLAWHRGREKSAVKLYHAPDARRAGKLRALVRLSVRLPS